MGCLTEQPLAACGGCIYLACDTELRLALKGRDITDGALTSTQPVGSPENPAFFYLAKWRKHHPDIILIAFLRNHSYEQFSVFHS